MQRVYRIGYLLIVGFVLTFLSGPILARAAAGLKAGARLRLCRQGSLPLPLLLQFGVLGGGEALKVLTALDEVFGDERARERQHRIGTRREGRGQEQPGDGRRGDEAEHVRRDRQRRSAEERVLDVEMHVPF